MFTRFFNVFLRIFALSTKLLLTLFLGKYLGLDALGTYGLVAAVVGISIPLLGFRLDYVVMREIVDATSLEIARKMRDQLIWYCITYAIFAIGVLAFAYDPTHGRDLRIVLFSIGLVIVESLGTITWSNMQSLRRPITANILYFIRSALWVYPVMIIGALYSNKWTLEILLYGWCIGGLVSVIFTFYMWRELPWRDAFMMSVDWDWLFRSFRQTGMIWMAGVALAGATYSNRFVVDAVLGRDFVGIISFYSSFVLAVGTLLESGNYAFARPLLISLSLKGEYSKMKNETIRLAAIASISCGILCLAIGFMVPWLAVKSGRTEFYTHAPTLWMMLFSSWIGSTTYLFYMYLYAMRKDKIICLNEVLQLFMALLAASIFVHFFGLKGVGYAAILTSFVSGAWRLSCAYFVHQVQLRA